MKRRAKHASAAAAAVFVHNLNNTEDSTSESEREDEVYGAMVQRFSVAVKRKISEAGVDLDRSEPIEDDASASAVPTEAASTHAARHAAIRQQSPAAAPATASTFAGGASASTVSAGVPVTASTSSAAPSVATAAAPKQPQSGGVARRLFLYGCSSHISDAHLLASFSQFGQVELA